MICFVVIGTILTSFCSLVDLVRTERLEVMLVLVMVVLVYCFFFSVICIGKHRCHPSGRGKAGGMHHLRILMDKLYVVCKNRYNL